MTSTRHTGVVISAKDADAWHIEIKQIMVDHKLNFGEAIDVYIARTPVAEAVPFEWVEWDNTDVDQSGWDAA